MKRLITLILMTVVTLQIACTTVPSVLENPDQQSLVGAEQAQVVNIRQVKLKANWKQHFAGAILGGALGQAIGNEAVGVAGVFIGAGIADHKYGREVDEVTIEDNSGNEYQTLVEASMFRVTDKVLFKHSNGQLTEISKI